MFFRTLKAFVWFAAIVVALPHPAVARAPKTTVVAGGARYIEIADAGESGDSSDQGAGAAEPNSSDGDDSEGDPEGSNGGQQSDFDESRRDGADDAFDGPNGALKAVQADRALPLDGIVAIARHLTNGQIVDTRLHPVRGVLQYELKVLEINNDVRRYSFNARTGKLIRVK